MKPRKRSSTKARTARTVTSGRRFNLLRNPIALVIVALVFLVAAPIALKSFAAVQDGEWQMACDVTHTAPDDPIVYPAVPGASHNHSFLANNTTNAFSSTESLMASSSGCARNMQNTDHSAYWFPTLYKNNADGTKTMVPTGNIDSFIYYQRMGGSAGPSIKPFPNGLRMITGNSKATTPQDTSIVHWSCGGGDGGPHTAAMPTCSLDQPLHAGIDFPNCWNGHDLDSADHKSHMAFAATNGTCPAGYPVSLPQIHIELDWAGVTGGSGYSISSGSEYSMHADFFAAWDVQVQNALVAECLNTPRICDGIERNGNSLSVPTGGPVPAFCCIDITKYPTTGTTGTLPSLSPTPTSTPVSSKVGDINGDNTVNVLDLSSLLSHWNTTNATGDLNHDSTVNVLDLSLLLSHWGT